ncbi:hypothetical protein BAUCODRAFT_455698 [Baudoinia panamericana UAMH 10762]|uniref:Uncharacterized protein n=1 Tax=Baudoinia panamericana (strain UAMH 10762) TaxID=717646 RepID=M2LSS7_BAUPA|nr:uncharacterized protein BAUCODRAFT_455698 [Baudoinia panamericana UAMH 10762]EMC97532.1 hypothetical protein BAUCODRAFT_455698 [Baudoinia panamericana UAMH 10762]
MDEDIFNELLATADETDEDDDDDVSEDGRSPAQSHAVPANQAPEPSQAPLPTLPQQGPYPPSAPEAPAQPQQGPHPPSVQPNQSSSTTAGGKQPRTKPKPNVNSVAAASVVALKQRHHQLAQQFATLNPDMPPILLQKKIALINRKVGAQGERYRPTLETKIKALEEMIAGSQSSTIRGALVSFTCGPGPGGYTGAYGPYGPFGSGMGGFGGFQGPWSGPEAAFDRLTDVHHCVGRALGGYGLSKAGSRGKGKSDCSHRCSLSFGASSQK